MISPHHFHPTNGPLDSNDFKYFLGAWLIFVSPFLVLVALSTPQESILL